MLRHACARWTSCSDVDAVQVLKGVALAQPAAALWLDPTQLLVLGSHAASCLVALPAEGSAAGTAGVPLSATLCRDTCASEADRDSKCALVLTPC